MLGEVLAGLQNEMDSKPKENNLLRVRTRDAR